MGENLSQKSKLGDTSVLELNITKMVEFFVVGCGKKSQRIDESKRRMDSTLRLESYVQGSEGLGYDRGRRYSGRTGKKGGDGKFHYIDFYTNCE